MLRIISNIRILNSIPETYSNYQSLRWIRKPRKPRWMPMAKSKMFKIPPRREFPIEEEREVTRLFNNYRTTMKSIKKYLEQRYSVKLQAKADTEQLQKTFEEDLARCMKINTEWNESVRVEREQRAAKKLQEEIDFAKKRIADVLRQHEQQLLKAEETVRREKKAATNFITPETIDDVIEKAINNPIDYNFAVDLDGNKIMGRETKPETTK